MPPALAALVNCKAANRTKGVPISTRANPSDMIRKYRAGINGLTLCLLWG